MWERFYPKKFAAIWRNTLVPSYPGAYSLGPLALPGPVIVSIGSLFDETKLQSSVLLPADTFAPIIAKGCHPGARSLRRIQVPVLMWLFLTCFMPR